MINRTLQNIIENSLLNKKEIITHNYSSPTGEMILGSCDGKLCLCDWINGRRHSRTVNRILKILNADIVKGDSDVIDKAMNELDEYFAHKRTSFDIPLMFAGTDFQKRVWQRLLDIPYGTTMSYSEMSRQLQCPKSVRAIANANGDNAISIIVPCHRIIGSNNTLGGYGGGLDAKRMLLKLESK